MRYKEFIFVQKTFSKQDLKNKITYKNSLLARNMLSFFIMEFFSSWNNYFEKLTIHKNLMYKKRLVLIYTLKVELAAFEGSNY